MVSLRSNSAAVYSASGTEPKPQSPGISNKSPSHRKTAIMSDAASDSTRGLLSDLLGNISDRIAQYTYHY